MSYPKTAYDAKMLVMTQDMKQVEMPFGPLRNDNAGDMVTIRSHLRWRGERICRAIVTLCDTH